MQLKGNGFGSSSLKGRVALITGGVRGIGRAIALGFSHRGAAVALNFKSSKEHAEALAEQIEHEGGDVMLVQGDVSEKGEAKRIVQEVFDRWKRIDILVNNAGITKDRSFRKMTDDEWSDVINVNLNGTYFCTSAALPIMIDQKFGRIINIGSLVSQAGAFGQANYAASKGGIVSFTKALALELARFNITANVVVPGYTCTDMLAKVPPDVLEQIRLKIPLGRLAKPEEMAKAAVFLAADADYITGQQLNVNGGMYM